MEQARTEQPTLKKGITGPLLFFFIVGDVLGAGVYVLVGKMSSQVGGAVWVPLLVALGLSMLTAASYAELVTKYPKAGGAAVFAERAFKRPLVSFLVGFSMLAAGVTSAAGLAVAFSGDYLQQFLAIPAVPAALGFLAVVALVNARGITESLRGNLVMTLVEVSGLFLVIAVGAWWISRGNGEPGRVLEFPDGTAPVAATFAASLIAYYSFVGYETSANMAEEVRDVSRVYPKALFAALLVAGLVYISIALVSNTVLPADRLSESSSPLLDVVRGTGSAIPGWIFSAVALTAVANSALLTMIMSSRLAYGMSRQGLLPEALGKVLPGRRTPWVAILATTLVAMVLTFTGELSVLAETVVLFLLVVFLSTNVAVLVLRKDTVDHPSFKVPAVVPALGALSCVVLMTQQSGGVWLRAAALWAVGAALYGLQWWMARRGGGTERTTSP